MANRFWITTGSATWDNSTTANWSTNSGGAGGASVPGSGDTAIFDANSGSGTITTNYAVSITALTLDTNYAGTVKFGATNTFTTSGAVTLTSGTLNTNGQTCSWGNLASSNSNTRTLTITNSTITCTGVGVIAWTTFTTTGLTFNSTGSTINITGSGSSFQSGVKTYNNLNCTGGGTSLNQPGGGGPIVANLTITGANEKVSNWKTNGTFTVTTTLTLGGNTTGGVNRLLINGVNLGNQRTFSMAGAAVVINGDVDFVDITFSGNPSFTNSGNAFVGDGGGNGSLVTSNATVATNQTWSGNTTGNWSNSANWTSRVPLPQDSVFVTGLTSGTITADMPRLGGTVDFTSSTGGTFTLNQALVIYGGLKLVSGMSFTGAQTITFSGRTTTYTLTSAGISYPGNLTMDCSSTGIYQLGDNLSLGSTATTTLSSGTFKGNNNNVTTGSYIAAASTTTNLGSGTWTASGTGSSVWSISGSITNPSTSTISITNNSTNQKTLTFGGQTYNNLTIASGGTGVINFGTTTATDTFNIITMTGPKSITIFAGKTVKFATFAATGTSGSLLTFRSSTTGTQYTLQNTTNVVSPVYYCDFKDCKVTNTTTNGPGLLNYNATDSGNNSGINMYYYTKAGQATLPSTNANITDFTIMADYNNIDTLDSITIDNSSPVSGFVLQQYKDNRPNDGNPFSVTWRGKSTEAASSNSINLQVYNQNTPGFETIATNSSVAANTFFTLTGTISSNLSNYYDSNNWITWRVYQAV